MHLMYTFRDFACMHVLAYVCMPLCALHTHMYGFMYVMRAYVYVFSDAPYVHLVHTFMVFMYVCTYTHTDLCTHTNRWIYVCMHVYTRIYAVMRTSYTHMDLCMYARMRIRMCALMHVCRTFRLKELVRPVPWE